MKKKNKLMPDIEFDEEFNIALDGIGF